MGKARVLGNNAQLLIHSQDLLAPIPLGELDSFSAKSRTTAIYSRPQGYVNEGVTLKYGGWDLSFEGGKVDWHLVHYYLLQDIALRSRGSVPELFISETVTHYNGAVENYIYKGVVLFGLETSKGIDEISEKIQGFASSKTMGVIDDTTTKDPTNLLREAIFRVRANIINVNDIERPF